MEISDEVWKNEGLAPLWRKPSLYSIPRKN